MPIATDEDSAGDVKLPNQRCKAMGSSLQMTWSDCRFHLLPQDVLMPLRVKTLSVVNCSYDHLGWEEGPCNTAVINCCHQQHVTNYKDHFLGAMRGKLLHCSHTQCFASNKQFCLTVNVGIMCSAHIKYEHSCHRATWFAPVTCLTRIPPPRLVAASALSCASPVS